jgi:hypothetical protein
MKEYFTDQLQASILVKSDIFGKKASALAK